MSPLENVGQAEGEEGVAPLGLHSQSAIAATVTAQKSRGLNAERLYLSGIWCGYDAAQAGEITVSEQHEGGGPLVQTLRLPVNRNREVEFPSLIRFATTVNRIDVSLTAGAAGVRGYVTISSYAL